MRNLSTICLLLLPVAITLANVLPARDDGRTGQSASACAPCAMALLRADTREPHSPTITAGIRN